MPWWVVMRYPRSSPEIESGTTGDFRLLNEGHKSEAQSDFHSKKSAINNSGFSVFVVESKGAMP
jgi:hypothetical protein